jgi:hypothetical protein
MKYLKLSLLPILIALILARSVARKRKKAQLENATSELFKAPASVIQSDATDYNYETGPRQTGKNEMESIKSNQDHCGTTKTEKHCERIKIFLEFCTLIVLIFTLIKVSEYTEEAFKQRVAMENAVSLTQEANNLTRKLLSTEAADIVIGSGAEMIQWDKRLIPIYFSNRGKMKATELEGDIEFICESLPDRKPIQRLAKIAFGGKGTTIGETLIQHFPLPEKCSDRQIILHTRAGIIRKWNIRYFDGLEKHNKSGCEEFLDLHWPQPGGGQSGWTQCHDVARLIERAVVPYEGN